MRKSPAARRGTAAALALGAAAFLLVPAGARASEYHVFNAPIPCAATCPYWTEPVNRYEAACLTPPLSAPGSFADWNVTIPSGFSILHFEIAPRFDFDSFLCFAPSNPGPNNTFFIGVGQRWLLEGWVCPTPVLGCAEEIDHCISATLARCLAPGTNVIVRVYNWFDPTVSIIGSLEYLG